MLFPFVTLLPLLRTDAITCQSGYEITRSSLPSVSKERQIAAATCSTAQYGSNPSCLRVEASMKISILFQTFEVVGNGYSCYQDAICNTVQQSCSQLIVDVILQVKPDLKDFVKKDYVKSCSAVCCSSNNCNSNTVSQIKTMKTSTTQPASTHVSTTTTIKSKFVSTTIRFSNKSLVVSSITTPHTAITTSSFAPASNSTSDCVSKSFGISKPLFSLLAIALCMMSLM